MRVLIAVTLLAVIIGLFLHGRMGGNDVALPEPVEAAGSVEEPELPEYLTFNRSVERGDFIRGEDLKWARVNLEKAEIPPHAMLRTDQQLSDFDGALVIADSNQGDFVNRRIMLLPQESRFLASVLEPGKRAISIEIGAVTGNSGLVQPGDRVDLILFSDLEPDEKAMKRGYIAKTILKDMRVIAIDRKIAYRTLEDVENTLSMMPGDLPKRSTATLEVTPRQAEIITVARRMGTLSLSLRSNFEPEGEGVQLSTASRPVRARDVIREIPELAEDPELEVVQFLGMEKRRENVEPRFDSFDGVPE